MFLLWSRWRGNPDSECRKYFSILLFHIHWSCRCNKLEKIILIMYIMYTFCKLRWWWRSTLSSWWWQSTLIDYDNQHSLMMTINTHWWWQTVIDVYWSLLSINHHQLLLIAFNTDLQNPRHTVPMLFHFPLNILHWSYRLQSWHLYPWWCILGWETGQCWTRRTILKLSNIKRISRN